MYTQLSLFQPDKEEALSGIDAVILRDFVKSNDIEILNARLSIIQISPYRRMITPGGYRMSAAMTNCRLFGWITDLEGYRYTSNGPKTGQPWPSMPEIFSILASTAAKQAGFINFRPDACLINLYEPGSKLSLHQDKDEKDFTAPIVSVSLGLPAIFLFGGARRSDLIKKVLLRHGDIVVWGGAARLAYHGVTHKRRYTPSSG
jgi:alkylated DNA repair protein (DNA oxidative demethylase)